MTGRPAVEAALRSARILVVGGPGGVGKTTTAASLALQAAVMGRRVLVCTIDPSRRLATSLGLKALVDRPRRLDLDWIDPAPEGEMWAMTLDTKRMFDALVMGNARDEEARRRILDNRFYRQVSAALAGSHEYMAMEKLLELSRDARFDLVVLDTPPTRHALDFLEAPDRMLAFLDTSVLRWFLKPYFVAGRLTLKVATRTGAVALKLADRVLGLQFLQDLSEFFLAFDGMYEGFKERAARVYELLRAPTSAFVVVASPSAYALEEARYFHRRLREKAMPFAVFVVNRVHTDPAETPPGRGPVTEVEPELGRRLVAILRDQQRLARVEGRAVEALAAETGAPVVAVPEFEEDVHDLSALKEVGELLLAADEVVHPRGTRGRRRIRRATGRAR